MKKLNKATKSGFEKKETVTYYQYNIPKIPHAKVKVIKKGLEILGAYEYTFVDEAFQNHLISTPAGNVTVKGCKSLNDYLPKLARGTAIRLVYLGTGKSAKPGRKPPFLWDVYDMSDESANSEDTQSEDTDASQEDEDTAF